MNKIFRRVILRVQGWFKARRQRVFVLTMSGELSCHSAKIPISIQNITPDNVERVTDFRDRDKERVFRRFLNEGQVGIYAISDSKVVGHAWAVICHKKRNMANGYFELQKGEVLIHFCNVKESCRGQGIYPAMLVALCKRLFGEIGSNKIFIDTEVDNIASVRGIQKAGFRPLGQYLFLQFRNTLIYKKSIGGNNNLQNFR